MSDSNIRAAEPLSEDQRTQKRTSLLGDPPVDVEAADEGYKYEQPDVARPQTGTVIFAENSPASKRQSAAALLFLDKVNDKPLVGDDGNDFFDVVDQNDSTQNAETRMSLMDKGRLVKHNTLMDPKYVKELESTEPQMLAFLRSSSGMAVQICLFLFYVSLDISKSLFNSKLMNNKEDPFKFNTQSLILVQGSLQIILGILTGFWISGISGIKEVLDPRRVLKFMAVSACFSMSQTFMLLSYSILMAGEIKIIGQVRLIQTAFLSRIVLGRRYVKLQWCVMIMVVLSAGSFITGKDEFKSLDKDVKNAGKTIMGWEQHHESCTGQLTDMTMKTTISECTKLEDETAYSACLLKVVGSCMEQYSGKQDSSDDGRELVRGLIYVFTYLFLADVGSIISEKFLKDGSSTPFYAQKTSLELGGLPIALFMSWAVPVFQQFIGTDEERWVHLQWWKPEHDLFMGWERPIVYGALLIATTHSWTAGLLVKRLSSVMKLLAKCCSLAGVYFIGDQWLLKSPTFSPPTVCTISAVNVVAGTYTFVLCKPDTKADALPKADLPALLKDRPKELELEQKTDAKL